MTAARGEPGVPAGGGGRAGASTLAFVCALLRLRSREPTLQARTQRLVGAAPDIFCFERQLDQ
jgi:hypothetical protein